MFCEWIWNIKQKYCQRFLFCRSCILMHIVYFSYFIHIQYLYTHWLLWTAFWWEQVEGKKNLDIVSRVNSERIFPCSMGIWIIILHLMFSSSIIFGFHRGKKWAESNSNQNTERKNCLLSIGCESWTCQVSSFPKNK